MGLVFGGASSDRVNHGSPTLLDGLSPATYTFWVYPTTFTDARAILHKGSASNTGRRISLSGTSGAVGFRVQRATTACLYVTSSFMTLNAWNFIAALLVPGRGTGIVDILLGSLTTPAVEGSYSSSSDGSGAVSTDGADDFIIGNLTTAASAFQGVIANYQAYNRELSVAEIRQIQYKRSVFSGCILNCNPGWHGGSSVIDLSGNLLAGTITGATVDRDVPLGGPFGIQSQTSYFAASGAFTQDVAGGLTPTGALVNVLNANAVSVGGTIVPVGDLTELGIGLNDLDGTIVPTGSVSLLLALLNHSVEGEIVLAGEVSFTPGITPSGVITPVGTLTMPTSRQDVVGAITPSGVVSSEVRGVPGSGHKCFIFRRRR